MSPSAAFSSDMFRTYAGVVLGLLLAGGLLIAILRWVTASQRKPCLAVVYLLAGDGPGGPAGHFCRPRAYNFARHALGRLRLQGICPGHRAVSRLADDRRGLRRHRCHGPGFVDGRPHLALARLVRAVCGPAGLRHHRHLADPHPSQPRRGAAPSPSPWRSWDICTSAGCSAIWRSWPTPAMPTGICST